MGREWVVLVDRQPGLTNAFRCSLPVLGSLPFKGRVGEGTGLGFRFSDWSFVLAGRCPLWRGGHLLSLLRQRK